MWVWGSREGGKLIVNLVLEMVEVLVVGYSFSIKGVLFVKVLFYCIVV